MPWHVAESAECPVAKPWAVIKDADGSIVACHESEDNAKQQVKALYANEPGARYANGGVIHDDYVRAMPFEIVPASDGLTFEGYAVPFDIPAHIRDWAGEYDETIAPGAFDRSLRQRMPNFLYEHGQHPLIGNIPLGVIQDVSKDSRGYHVRARMSENWLIQPVRDAIRDGAIDGMSVHFNFRGIKGGEIWSQEDSGKRHRVVNANLVELGPVLRPAYQLTSASIRSILDRLPPDLAPPAQVGGQGEDIAVDVSAAQRAQRKFRYATRTQIYVPEEANKDG